MGKIIFDRNDQTSIHFMDGTTKYYSSEIDTVNHLFKSSYLGDTISRYELKYERLNSEELKLAGFWMGSILEIVPKRMDPDSFELTKRGFKWINEIPYNR